MTELTWDEVEAYCNELLDRITKRHGTDLRIYGVPTGGSMVAAVLRSLAGTRVMLLEVPEEHCVVVDDLIDSGTTLRRYQVRGLPVYALIKKSYSPVGLDDDAAVHEGWVRFPWEHASRPEDAVVRLLSYIGEDPNRNGLRETPERVCKMLKELTIGYSADIEEILSRCFDVTYDEMVVLKAIAFTSLCEHHLLPFVGVATVGYIPNKKVVGISKLARVVDAFARRLQVQERMTNQIAAAIQKELDPLGVGVVLAAAHACMGCRGVGKPGAAMVTSAMLGHFRDKPDCRAEFLAFTKG